MSHYKYALFCDENGRHDLGSDSYYRLDARNRLSQQIQDCRERKARFAKGFPNKVKNWTHIMLLRDISSTSGIVIELETGDIK